MRTVHDCDTNAVIHRTVSPTLHFLPATATGHTRTAVAGASGFGASRCKPAQSVLLLLKVVSDQSYSTSSSCECCIALACLPLPHCCDCFQSRVEPLESATRRENSSEGTNQRDSSSHIFGPDPPLHYLCCCCCCLDPFAFIDPSFARVATTSRLTHLRLLPYGTSLQDTIPASSSWGQTRPPPILKSV